MTQLAELKDGSGFKLNGKIYIRISECMPGIIACEGFRHDDFIEVEPTIIIERLNDKEAYMVGLTQYLQAGGRDWD